jgi:hypothetical protein
VSVIVAETHRKEECVWLSERIKALTKFISHFTVRSRLWKSVQLNLKLKSSNLRILASYRVLSANFNQFIERLDAILKYLYNPKYEFLI